MDINTREYQVPKFTYNTIQAHEQQKGTLNYSLSRSGNGPMLPNTAAALPR